MAEQATSLRQRVRAEMVREITDAARARLAADGSAALSLRAVARDMGMVSSALYRYFPSRDHLLTALIVDAYDSLGEAVEQAERAADRADLVGRFRAVGLAARRWALAHPHEYALVYGSPVPGYAAPEDTIGPATRVGVVLRDIVVDAHRTGRLDVPTRPTFVGARADLDRLSRDYFAGLPPAVIARGLMAWTHLFGAINFELFGHLHTVIDDYDAWFECTLDELVALSGVRG